MKTKGFYRKNMNKEPTNKNFLAFRPTSFSLLGPCSAKMGAVAWPKIHPNALENFGSNYLRKPKSLEFSQKSYLCVSEVHEFNNALFLCQTTEKRSFSPFLYKNVHNCIM